MNASDILFFLILIQFKHLVVDFFLQTEYQWKNKGTFGHPGGILHSGLHVVATVLILLLYGIAAKLLLIIAAVEFIVHYMVDWAKMNLNTRMGWAPTSHKQFWDLLGADQFLHQLTYLWIAYTLL